jgi:integrase/recombinase XerD
VARRGDKTAPPRLSRLSGASDPQSMATWAERYIEWLRVKHYSEQTAVNHESALALFIAWCELRGVSRPAEVTKPIIERYQRHLFHLRVRDKPLTAWTQKARLSAVKSYFKWLTRQNVLLFNPASELEMPKVVATLPKHILSADEVETVLAGADVDDALGLRDRAILEVLYSTAIRRGELIALTVFDLDARRGTLLIRHGKGQKSRVVPIGERAAAWVDKYVREVRQDLVCGIDEGTLFLTHAGESLTSVRLTQMVRRRVLAAGLGKQGSCHLFRHTAATLMLEGGADIRFIQALLGHASVATTQIYTQVSIKKLQAVHRATHPGATLERKRVDEEQAEEGEQSAGDLDSLLAAELDDEGDAEDEPPRA